MEVQTLQLFNMDIQEQGEQKGIVAKVRSGREVMKMKTYGHGQVEWDVKQETRLFCFMQALEDGLIYHV